MFRKTIAALALAPLALSSANAASDPAAGRGPYKVAMKSVPGLPHHTVYLPADLSALDGAKLPVFVWGNGGCEDVGNRYRYFLSDIASHGYLVIALGNIGPASAEGLAKGWPKEPVLPDTPFDVNAPAPSYPEEMTQAIDWAIAQDSAAGSALNGKIDTSKIAVSGHSCGALQALTIAAADPRITTTLMLDSGVWTMGPGGLPGAPKVTKKSLGEIHGSIAYINGEHDVALPNAKDDFSRIDKAPALLAYRKDVAHSGTFWLANGGAWGTVSTAWLDWQLKGDRKASRWFLGKDCRLCTDPRWTIERKNLR
ncbi:MAG TPA: hypothetical protein VNZ43_03085 [Sphingomonadaceae bacterium]|nr:hypothetical protein [Sphingomonadaceae bacterium]